MSPDLFGPEPEPEEPPRRTPSDWEMQARIYVQRLPKGWRGIAEEIRMELHKMGLSKPGSPNVWGSFIKGCIDRGFLMRTGKRRPMREMRSHGRMTDVYERT